MELKEKKFLQKVIFIGDEKCGKTSIITRFVDDKFDLNVKSTIGADFLSRDVEINETIVVKQQIWDKAGAKRFRSLGLAFYRGSDAIILVLDGTQPLNESAIVEHIKNAQQMCEDVPIYVAVNKCDLKLHEDFEDASKLKQVFSGQGVGLKDECIFFCSAQKNENIDELFKKIALDFANSPDLIKHSFITRTTTPINTDPPKSPSAIALFFSGLWKKHKLWLAGNGVILAGAAVFFTLAAFAVGSFLTFGILPSAFIGAGIIVGGAFALWNIGYGIYTCYKDSRYQKVVPSEETSDDSIEKPLPTNPSVDKKTREKFKNDDIEPMFGNLPSGVNVEDASDSDNEDKKNKKFGM